MIKYVGYQTSRRGEQMTDNKQRYKTTIAGRTYTIVAKKSEKHLKTVSELANVRINQLKDLMPKLDIEQRAILVAVNAISENITKQAELNELKGLLDTIEKSLEQQKKRNQTLQNQLKKVKNEKASTEPMKKETLSKTNTSEEKDSETKQSRTKFIKPKAESEAVLQKEQSKTVSKQFVRKQDIPAITKKNMAKQAGKKKTF